MRLGNLSKELWRVVLGEEVEDMSREDVGEHVQLRLGDLGKCGLHERAVGHVRLHHEDGCLPMQSGGGVQSYELTDQEKERGHFSAHSLTLSLQDGGSAWQRPHAKHRLGAMPRHCFHLHNFCLSHCPADLDPVRKERKDPVLAHTGYKT